MVEKLSVQIALVGGKEVEQQLAGIGQAGTKAFGDITKAAEQVGGADKAAQSFAKATSQISQLGSTMQQALDGATVAAKKFGASSGELAGVETVIRALGARARDGGLAFAQLSANYDKARSGAGQVAAAVATAGAAIAQTVPRLSAASREAENLAARLLRLGAAAAGVRQVEALSGVARSLGGFGLAAAGAVALGAGLFKITEAAAASAKAITDLASATGESVQNIATLQGAFSSAGVKTEDFQKGFAALTQRILNDGPKLAQEAQQTAGRIIDAELKVQAAYANAGQARQQLGRLDVVERRERENAVKSDRDFAEQRLQNIRSIEDAESRLTRLQIEDRVARGQLGRAEAGDQLKRLEISARALALEKAEQDVIKARRQQQEDDQRRAREQEDRQQQAEDRARQRQDFQRREVEEERNKQKALRELREQQGNDINAFVALFQQAAQGVQGSTAGLNTSVENFSKGIVASLAQAGVGVDEFKRGAAEGLGNPAVRAAVLQLADSLHTMAGSADELKIKAALLGLGLSRDFVDALSKGSQSILEAEERFKSLGLALTELETTNLTAFSKAMTALGGTVEALTAKFGAGFAAAFTAQLETINKALENSSGVFAKAGEAVATYSRNFVRFGFAAPFTAFMETVLKTLGKIPDATKEVEKSATDMGDGLLRSTNAPLRAADEYIKKLDVVKQKQEQLAKTPPPTKPEPTWMAPGRDPTGRTPHTDMTFGREAKQEAQQAFQKIDQDAQASAQRVQQAFAAIDLSQSITMNWENLLANVQAVADQVRALFTIDLSPYITMDWGNIISNAFTAADSIASAFSGIDIASALNSQIDSIISQLRELESAARAAAAAVNDVGSSGGGGGGGGASGLASGGLFRGRPGRDTNLAWLSDMEYIMRPEAVKKYGLGLMHMINSMQFPGFAMGGLNLRPAAVVAGGGAAGAQNTRVMHLTIGDQTFRNLIAPESTAKQLERAAIIRQFSSTGVKPGWRR